MQKLNLGEEFNAQTPTTPTELATATPTPTTSYTPTPAPGPIREKGSSSMKGKKSFPIVLAVVAIVAGVLTGLGAFKLQAKSGGGSLLSSGEPTQRVAGDSVSAGQVFGVQDEKTFKDSAEGYLEIGGLDGEGSHKLLRVGGDAQTVYLTSSITDLNKFDGMNVKVWGETFKAQKAGWLMDVGRVQVVDVEGQKPTED